MNCGVFCLGETLQQTFWGTMQPRVFASVARWLSLEQQARVSRLSRHWRDVVYMAQECCRTLSLDLTTSEHRWILNSRARTQMAKRLGVSLRELKLRYVDQPNTIPFRGTVLMLRAADQNNIGITKIEWFIHDALHAWLPQLTRLDLWVFPPHWIPYIGLYRGTSLTEVRLPPHIDQLSTETHDWMQRLAPRLVRWTGPRGRLEFASLSQMRHLTLSCLSYLPIEFAFVGTLPHLRTLGLMIHQNTTKNVEAKWIAALEETAVLHPLLEEIRIDRPGEHIWYSGNHGRNRAMVCQPPYIPDESVSISDLALEVLNFQHHDVPIERVTLGGDHFSDDVFQRLEQLKPNHLIVDPDTIPIAFAKRWTDFPRCLTLARLPSFVGNQQACTTNGLQAVEEVSLHFNRADCWDWLMETLPLNFKRLVVTTEHDQHVDTCRTLSHWMDGNVVVTVNGVRTNQR
jgi:hypothetical protein